MASRSAWTRAPAPGPFENSSRQKHTAPLEIGTERGGGGLIVVLPALWYFPYSVAALARHLDDHQPRLAHGVELVSTVKMRQGLGKQCAALFLPARRLQQTRQAHRGLAHEQSGLLAPGGGKARPVGSLRRSPVGGQDVAAPPLDIGSPHGPAIRSGGHRQRLRSLVEAAGASVKLRQEQVK